MYKTTFTRLVFLAAALALLSPASGQQIQLQKLDSYTNGMVFKDNVIWQATEASLIKRDLTTGEILQKYPLIDGTDGYYGITADAMGNLWVTLGAGGIARLDGTENWQIWNHFNSPGLPDGFQYSGITVNAAGEVWVSGWNNDISINSLFYFDGANWQQEPGLSGHYFRQFVNGPQGEFILCLHDSLLIRANNTWTSIPEPNEGPYNYIENPAFDNEGKLWITSEFSKFYRYDNLGQLPQLMTESDQDVTKMLFDAAGNLLTATYEEGLGRWNGNSWEFLPTVAGTDQKTFMTDIEMDPNGKLWIAQSIPSNNQLISSFENNAPDKNYYSDILNASLISRDGVGNLWFGGNGPVLTRQKLADGSLEFFELFDYADEFWIPNMKLVSGAGEEMWLATAENNVLHFDGSAWSLFDAPEIPEYVYDMAVSSNGTLFISGYSSPGFEDKIVHFNPANQTWNTIDFSIFGNWNSSVSDLEADEAGNLWFSTDQGLGKRSSDGSLEIFPTPGSGPGFFGQMEIKVGAGGKVFVLEITDFALYLSEFDNLTGIWTEIPVNLQVPNQWQDPYYLRWHVDQQNRIWMTCIDVFLDEQYFWFWDAGVWNSIPNALPTGCEAIASDGNGTVHFGMYKYVGRFKSSGRIEGLLRRDSDNNCTVGTGDTPLPGFLLMATDGAQQYLGLSRPDGQYRIYSGAGEVTVNAVPPNNLWQSCTPDGVTVTVDEDTSVNLDFLLRPAVECPQLSVDLSAAILRRCFNNTYTAKICNNGTTTANDAWVDITLPDEMEMVGAGLIYTEIAPKIFRFQLGDIEIGACKTFPVVIHVNCDNTFIGQTLCVTAAVFPDSICVPSTAAWSGATVLMDAVCNGDSVRFTVTNTGSAATSQPLQYRLLRNITPETSGNFTLTPGQSRSFSAPATGDTWRLISDQEPGHPFLPRIPSLAVEGCITGSGSSKTGLVTAFSNSSGSAFSERECMELIGSFDPNDKAASPKGVGENTHFILPGTTLDYTIRFQNTGTDTAFTVIVRDTIDRLFDLASFQPGASSHPYRLDIEGNALAFVFENILLPDSNINVAGSQGYLSFRIRPRNDIPLGSVVTNSAGIYFDFNDPVITNTVWHVVDNSFLQTVGTNQPEQPEHPQLLVFPNPAQNTFRVKAPAGQGILEMFDLQGRLLQQIRVSADAPVAVACSDCPAGLYALRFVNTATGMVTGGKVMMRKE